MARYETSNRAKCPTCKSRCKTLRSEQISSTLREIRYLCENKECGHIFIAHLEVVRTLLKSDFDVKKLPLFESTTK